MEENLVDVKLWDRRISSYNVTFFCDRLIEKYGQGTIVLDTETNCISWRNIEYQSSGFELKKVEQAKIILQTNPQNIREQLYIPNDYSDGFLREMSNDAIARCQAIPTKQFGHSYILSFAVGGEFDLTAYFVPQPTFLFPRRPILIFEKSFSCK